ncbi:MAG: hypothetical protein QOH05_1823 [Acetobacteraceae bacterium]|jgi:hypothetical protein|nr:hypothetical protein [Acetobacteraceae bacterium]
MTCQLVVTKPFLDFVRGDIISEATDVSHIISSEYKKFVTKVALPTASKG